MDPSSFWPTISLHRLLKFIYRPNWLTNKVTLNLFKEKQTTYLVSKIIFVIVTKLCKLFWPIVNKGKFNWHSLSYFANKKDFGYENYSKISNLYKYLGLNWLTKIFDLWGCFKVSLTCAMIQTTKFTHTIKTLGIL